MTARCKFQVTAILPAYATSDPDQTAKRVVFETRYDQSVPEDLAFTKATPSGRMDVVIENPTVLAAFKVGDNVYIDIFKID